MDASDMLDREPNSMLRETAQRLEKGWVMCESERNPVRVRKLEKHWLNLLDEYRELHERFSDE